jgi:hypothetical protein
MQLESLSVYGRLAGGNFSDGVSRIGYSDTDLAGRKYLRAECRWYQPLTEGVDRLGGLRARSQRTPPVLS